MAHTPRLKRGAYPTFALVASGLLVASLGACVGSGPEIFRKVPVSATVTDESNADWPRLADIPPAPPPGVHTDATPDPALGDAAQIDAAVSAEAAETRRAALAGPIE
ncbi:hypothetical protein G5B40_16265 [Pikeienuella piscinae]|uniref:DUF3035 domain-containing protein n=1 Tax=Pikeienuella piscinae TaxID=2748098 RepID=A0A7L5C0E4_9RHOB|nr:hypothetical protein [Pikeienuella piscinae]QIE56853.1 hypothetical protein G5B40_16265 [Pikeienuella piscinae]